MDKVLSKDGTSIAFQRSGVGSPFILVHGTSGSSQRWKPILPALEKHFTVCAVDRRGRGRSGDNPSYSIKREFEDVTAVVDAVAKDTDAANGVNLLGHSYGALCSLEAALRTTRLCSLILYEPPLPLPGLQLYPEGIVDRLQALLDAGDPAGVVVTFMREVVKMPPHELELLQSSSAFPSRIAAAHTLPRELRDHQVYRFQPERVRNLSIPILLLLGGDSPPMFKAAIEAVHEAIPSSKLVVLPGQQHIAMDTAPDLFVREVLSFLEKVTT